MNVGINSNAFTCRLLNVAYQTSLSEEKMLQRYYDFGRKISNGVCYIGFQESIT
jgi:hypothetical protein